MSYKENQIAEQPTFIDELLEREYFQDESLEEGGSVTDLLRHSDTILIKGWMQAAIDGMADIEPEDMSW